MHAVLQFILNHSPVRVTMGQKALRHILSLSVSKLLIFFKECVLLLVSMCATDPKRQWQQTVTSCQWHTVVIDDAEATYFLSLWEKLFKRGRHSKRTEERVVLLFSCNQLTIWIKQPSWLTNWGPVSTLRTGNAFWNDACWFWLTLANTMVTEGC